MLSASCILACGGRTLGEVAFEAASADPAAKSSAGGVAAGGTSSILEGGAFNLGGATSLGGGTVQASCESQRTLCGNGPEATCVDLWHDASNCGSCGVVCPFGEICIGTCTLAGCRNTFMNGFLHAVETGASPSGVVTGDWNADGRLDIATANAKDNTVSVLLGCGDGALASRLNFGTGANPVALATGDLNGDRKLDLATVNYDARTVSVLLGIGDGTFSAKSEYDVGAQSASLAIGDLNGDGTNDIVVADYDARGVGVLLGKGDGTLAARSDFSVAGNPRQVTIADLNGDRAPDLVTANANTAYGESVLLGSGDGAFGNAIETNSSLPVAALVAADLSGDGVPDLGVADASTRGGGCGLGLLPGNGDGTFASKVQYKNPTWQCYHSITAGDLNGDGMPDLIAASGKEIGVMLGPAGGESTSPTSCPFEGFDIALGDVNGDDKLDVVGTNASTNRLHLLLGRGDGTFR